MRMNKAPQHTCPERVIHQNSGKELHQNSGKELHGGHCCVSIGPRSAVNSTELSFTEERPERSHC